MSEELLNLRIEKLESVSKAHEDQIYGHGNRIDKEFDNLISRISKIEEFLAKTHEKLPFWNYVPVPPDTYTVELKNEELSNKLHDSIVKIGQLEQQVKDLKASNSKASRCQNFSCSWLTRDKICGIVACCPGRK